MNKKFSLLQKLAWLFALMFLGVVTVSHWPGANDAEGRLFGLFKIDPIDDIFHLLSGLVGVVAAWHSAKWSRVYFFVVSIPYGLDALTGFLFSREFLNGNVFMMPLGGPDFSVRNILINLPHVLITVVGLWIAFRLKAEEAPGLQIKK